MTPGLKELTELYGGGPLAAFIGSLFILLIYFIRRSEKSEAAHRTDLREVLPLVARMTDVVERDSRRSARRDAARASLAKTAGGADG